MPTLQWIFGLLLVDYLKVFLFRIQKAQTSSCLFTSRGLRIALKVKQTTGNLRRYDKLPCKNTQSRVYVTPIGIYCDFDFDF